MNVDDFDYDLPQGLIAQLPGEQRDGSRLMGLDRRTGSITHHRFHELPQLLEPGDLLVLNDTRVLPARLSGRKESGGRVEVLMVEPRPDGTWYALLQASRSPRVGAEIRLGPALTARVAAREGDGWNLRFTTSPDEVMRTLDRLGRMPLPPYIHRDPEDPRGAIDRERYQTIYARTPGAVAAPTAGLHFTRRVLDGLGRRGLQLAYLTLHVGPGTFLPVRTPRVEDHRMHDEAYSLPPETAEAVDATRRRGGRVVAVGTTVVRTLEASAGTDGRVTAGEGSCGLFIYPGFRFRVVDAMITNFHLPRSTLLMLVAAFAGRESVLAAYAEAVRSGYRFYSYGDGMLVIER